MRLIAHYCLAACVSLVALGLATPAAHSQTILAGHHDNNATGSDGYDAFGPDAYLVPTDMGTTADATFNKNNNYGLYASGAVVNINGGQFNNDGSSGLYATNNSRITLNGGQFSGSSNGKGLTATNGSIALINGGTFSNNGDAGAFAVNTTNLSSNNANIVITNGTFSNNGYGVSAFGSNVAVSGGIFSGSRVGAILASSTTSITVTGGTFSGNQTDFLVYSNSNTSFDVYGAFDGLSPGESRQLVANTNYNFFVGQLKFASAPQTFTYGGDGIITLHNVGVAAPEPSPCAVLLVGVLSVGALIGKARKRRAA